MNVWKRSLLSVRRKPIKSVLLLLIVFLIASFLLAGMASKNTSIAVQNKSRQAVGAAYRLEINEADRRKRLDDLEPVQYPNGAWGTPVPNNEFESLLMSDIEKIAAVEGIASYNVTTRTTLTRPVGFKRIEDSEKDQHMDFGGVNLYGNQDMQMDFNVRDENIRLLEGRFAQPEDKDTAVISSDLAALNSLKVGDSISFEPLDNEKAENWCTATIIGIFTIEHPIPSTMNGDTFRSENTIFTDLHLPEKAEGRTGDPCFKYATFYVENVEKYDAVKERIRQLDINWLRYDLIDNNGVSEQMAENFNSLSYISNLLIVIVSVCSLLILFFVFAFWTKSRNHEIGILLALGKSKKSILFQFLLEAAIVGCVAIVFAGLASPVISGRMARYLVGEQHSQALEAQQMSEGLVMHSSNIDVGQDAVLGIAVSIEPQMLLLAGALTLTLIVCAVTLGSQLILRHKPIRILSEMS